MLRSLGTFLANFAVAGLTQVRAQLTGFAGAISGALARIGHPLSLGSIINDVKRLGGALESAGRSAVGLAGHLLTLPLHIADPIKGIFGAIDGLVTKFATLKTVIYGALAAAPFVAFKKAIAAAKEDILAVDDVSDITGLKADDVAAIRTVAHQSGVAVEDLQQSLVKLSNEAEDAKNGGPAAAYFKQLGISVVDAEGKMRPLIDIMKDVGNQSKLLDDASRTSVLSNLFGIRNVKNIAGLLNDIGSDSWENIKASALQQGPAITDEDVQNAKQMQKATAQLSDAWASLRLEFFRGFNALVTQSLGNMAGLIQRNKVAIVDFARHDVAVAIQFLNDFWALVVQIDSIAGTKILYAPIDPKHLWMFKVREVAIGLWHVIQALVSVVPVLAHALDTVLAKVTGKNFSGWITELRTNASGLGDQLADWLRHAADVIADFIYVVSFQDGNITTDTGREMKRWRDVLVGWVENAFNTALGLARKYLVPLFDFVVAVVNGILAVWKQVSAGFASGDLKGSTDAWFIFGAAVRDALVWLSAFAVQLYDVFVLQRAATGQFAWINVVVDWMKKLWVAAQAAWAGFVGFYNGLSDFLAFFHIDLKSTLLFLGLLQLSGILPAIIGLITGVITAIQFMITIGVFDSPIALGLIYLITLTTAFYELLEHSPVNDFFRGITDSLYGTNAALANAGKNMDAFYEKLHGAGSLDQFSLPPSGSSQPSISAAERSTPSISANAGYTNPFGEPTTNVTLNIPGLGDPMRAVVPSSDLNQALNARALSRRGDIEMAPRPDTTLYLGPDIVIPLRAALGFDEDWSEVGEPQFRDTWNGRAKVLRPSYRRKYDIAITGNGNGVWRTPGLDGVAAGDVITVWSCRWQTWRILAGERTCTLSRPPVPGSVKVVHPLTEAVVASTIDDRTVTIEDDADELLAVLFLPVLTCVVGGFSGSASGNAGTAQWAMKLREQTAPAP